MPVYPTAITARTEPPDEPERTPCDWMRECAHSSACKRVYEMFAYGRGSDDAMADALGCDDCDEWEE